MFDSTRLADRPRVYPLNGLIAGWAEAVQLMVVGEERRVWIPEELAYGSSGRGPSGTLVFDIELLAIRPRADAPPE